MTKGLFVFLYLTTVTSIASANVNLWYGAKTYSQKINEFCDYKIIIPVLKSGNGVEKTGIKALNTQWEAEALSHINDFEVATAEEGMCEDFSSAYQEDTSLQLTTNLDSKYASMVFTHYGYYGGAHGNSGRTSIIFNTESGQVIGDLSSVLAYSAIDKFKSTVEKQLIEEKEIEPDFGWDTVKASWQSVYDVKNFYLTPNGIVVYFDPYAVAPYAAGPQDVEITWYELNEMGLADTDLAKQYAF